MNNRLVIFDGNHLAYRAYYKFMNLQTLDGAKTGVIYGMPYITESLIRRLSPDKVVVVFDGGRSLFRIGLLPSYKERDKKLGFDVEDFFRQKDMGREIFMALGLLIAYQKNMEADDLIAMITRRYSQKEWDVIIVSGDKDFNQLISYPEPGLHGEITIYNTGKGKEIGYTTLPKLVGYTVEQTVDYLAITGDKSDKISGYPGIGPKRALDLLNKYGSVKNFLKSGDKFGKIDKEKLKGIWKLNKQLIDLKFFYRKFLMGEKIPWINPVEKFDEDKLKKICSTYEINSFLKPQFIKTFKNLKHA